MLINGIMLIGIYVLNIAFVIYGALFILFIFNKHVSNGQSLDTCKYKTS